MKTKQKLLMFTLSFAAILSGCGGSSTATFESLPTDHSYISGDKFSQGALGMQAVAYINEFGEAYDDGVVMPSKTICSDLNNSQAIFVGNSQIKFCSSLDLI